MNMKEKVENKIFSYESPEAPSDAIFSISPSQIEKFFTCPKVWYQENILEEKLFNGNTSTYIGTIAHYIYKCVTENIEVNRENINNELDQYLLDVPNKEVNADEVKTIYPLVVNKVVNDYVIPHNNLGCLIKCEQPIIAKVIDGIYVKGTYDRLEGTILCDYKTVSTKPNEYILPFGYKIQLLAYAYALQQQGIEVDRIRIIYGIKPTKTLPARCVVVTENIEYKDIKLIKDTLTLIGESVLKIKENPELTYLIFKSMDLKKE